MVSNFKIIKNNSRKLCLVLQIDITIWVGDISMCRTKILNLEIISIVPNFKIVKNNLSKPYLDHLLQEDF